MTSSKLGSRGVRFSNSATTVVAAADLEIADHPASRARGLMFRNKPASILFVFPHSGKHGIHSFFVRFPFDAVYLDERKRVVAVFARVPPGTAYLTPEAPAKFLLELPEGKAGEKGIKIGSVLEF